MKMHLIIIAFNNKIGYVENLDQYRFQITGFDLALFQKLTYSQTDLKIDFKTGHSLTIHQLKKPT